MTTLRGDKTSMVIQEKFEGVKYLFFLGQHYKSGHSCFDIAILNQWSGVIAKLHFPTKEECYYKWNQLKEQYHSIELRRSISSEDEDKLVNLSETKQ